jgi:DNA-binding response OmpR family regulator
MPKVILVVDDEPSSADLLRFVLEWSGYRVLTAHDGRVALEILSREPVDLVLSDVMMPVMDGIELCKELQRGASKGTPLLLVTAAPEWVRTNGCEPVAILPKPVDVDALCALIEHTLRQQGALPDPGSDA